MKISIIGNGFDLDFKLNTRYSDFAKSEQWKNLYLYHPKEGDSSAHFFRLANKEKWFDIEEGMAN